MGKSEITLEVDAALLERARGADIDLNAALEAGLKLALAMHRSPGVSDVDAPQITGPADAAASDVRAEAWARENAEAIASYNERVQRRGIFGEDLRRW